MTELRTALTVTGSLTLLIGLMGIAYLLLAGSSTGMGSAIVVTLAGLVSLSAGHLMRSVPNPSHSI